MLTSQDPEHILIEQGGGKSCRLLEDHQVIVYIENEGPMWNLLPPSGIMLPPSDPQEATYNDVT
jgi:hypothetical protein